VIREGVIVGNALPQMLYVQTALAPGVDPSPALARQLRVQMAKALADAFVKSGYAQFDVVENLDGRRVMRAVVGVFKPARGEVP